MSNLEPATDLEMFEILVAAYPERFDENADGCIWDEVMGWAEETFGDIDVIMDFVGRVAMLAPPMSSAISGELRHCLGVVKKSGDSVHMTTCISRPFKTQ